MKNLKKIIIMAVVMLSVGTLTINTFAKSNYNTPAEAVAALTNKTVEAVRAEKQESQKTYGKIAAEAGKLEEFKLERIQIRKDRLTKQVTDGKITQKKADEILADIEARQANCTGDTLGKNHGGGHKKHQGLNLKDGSQTRSGLRLQDGTGNKESK